jgi:hypothetical protein
MKHHGILLQFKPFMRLLLQLFLMVGGKSLMVRVKLVS